jgi:hypothetical protein
MCAVSGAGQDRAARVGDPRRQRTGMCLDVRDVAGADRAAHQRRGPRRSGWRTDYEEQPCSQMVRASPQMVRQVPLLRHELMQV